MAVRNGKVILSKNIKMDSGYRNVLNISESDMITLMSNSSNIVYTNSTYSFMRENENSIYVEAPYGTCLQANYLAFQNPDYSNKWFFAFVEEVNYVSNKTTEIKYKVDIFTTWNSYFSYKSCFVIREHVTDDSYHKHTVPEGLETGDYMVKYTVKKELDITNCHIVMATNINPLDGITAVGGGVYGGIVSGCSYYIFQSNTDFNNALVRIANGGNSDSIVSIFYAPDWITNYNNASWNQGVAIVPNSQIATSSSGIAIPLQPTTIGNYTPANKKLFNWPYVSYVISNNAGGSAEYHLEDFYDGGSHVASFDLYGTCTPGCSIRLVPHNYKVASLDLIGNDFINNEYGITAGKLPIASWENDAYTNWLTQNAVNKNFQLAGATFNAIAGTVKAVETGGEDMYQIGQGFREVFDVLRNEHNHSFNAIGAEGNINSGDVSFSARLLGYTGYFMEIKEEYARIIDNYFKLKGYKVNTVKVPNTSHRQNFNFVQISGEDSCVYSNSHNGICVPPKDLDFINSLFRRGVTIWNNHANLGDLSVSNNIVN